MYKNYKDQIIDNDKIEAAINAVNIDAKYYSDSLKKITLDTIEGLKGNTYEEAVYKAVSIFAVLPREIQVSFINRFLDL